MNIIHIMYTYTIWGKTNFSVNKKLHRKVHTVKSVIQDQIAKLFSTEWKVQHVFHVFVRPHGKTIHIVTAWHFLLYTFLRHFWTFNQKHFQVCQVSSETREKSILKYLKCQTTFVDHYFYNINDFMSSWENNG